jgi:hypothetical protein
MNTLRLEWRDRVIRPNQSPRRFLEFVVDERALMTSFGGDWVTGLGLGFEEQRMRQRLRLLDEPDLPSGRRSIYLCPECGDLGCGAIGAFITERDNRIVWEDFAWESEFSDDEIPLEPIPAVGPFCFDRVEYLRVLQ